VLNIILLLRYIMTAFGQISGFLYVWSQLIILIPTVNAVSALTFADYILQPIYQTCEAPYVSRVLLAACAILILTILNCVSVKWVTRVQNVFTIGKIISLLIMISFGVYSLSMGKIYNIYHY
jgi:L-type amino acid transporter 5